MNIGGLAFFVVSALLICILPRRSAPIPLLLAAAYTTRLPLLELGPANLSVLRLLVLVGSFRVVARGERFANGVNSVDRLLCVWATFLIASSAFHTSDAWTFRLGMVMGELGTYALCRVFIQNDEDILHIFKSLSLLMLPLAVLMVLEKATAHNYFSAVGQFVEVNIRDGHVRAYGPFAHPILAGTVGATLVPMALYLWKRHRVYALVGLFSAIGIVFASTSSGPIMMVAFTLLGLLLWRLRQSLRLVRIGTLLGIVALQIVMKDPVYFLMARIDITGGSTGYHRAQLIRSSIEHLGEWWAIGTDYTRHWMATGIHADSIHTDITNHFLAMGVMGGFPLLFLFLATLTSAFRGVGRALTRSLSPQRAFLVWTLGAMLFGQVVNFWSISLFDQSVTFFYLTLAMIGSVDAPVGVTVSEKQSFSPIRSHGAAVAASGPRNVGAVNLAREFDATGWSTSRAMASKFALAKTKTASRER